MDRLAIAATLALGMAGAGCSHDDMPPYGPYWSYEAVLPSFDCMQDSVSTSFEGRVYPETRFVFGAADGCTWDKPNAKLTVNANTVWQHAPVVVELADGARENVGSEATRIVRWDVPPPELGGTLQFSQSQPLARTPAWALVDFVDFSGICILQVLGHD